MFSTKVTTNIRSRHTQFTEMIIQVIMKWVRNYLQVTEFTYQNNERFI